MIRVILFLFLISFAVQAHAYEAFFIEPASPADYTIIKNPEISKTYYAELVGYPHTYFIAAEENFTLHLQLQMPDGENESNDHSVIVVHNLKRGVEEVVRLRADNAGWEIFYDSRTVETYRAGEIYEQELDGGGYIVEVSTPDNIGKYTLIVGGKEKVDSIGYFKSVKDLYSVKKFLGTSVFSMILSPLIYVPLLLFAIIGLLVIFLRKKYA